MFILFSPVHLSIHIWSDSVTRFFVWQILKRMWISSENQTSIARTLTYNRNILHTNTSKLFTLKMKQYSLYVSQKKHRIYYTKTIQFYYSNNALCLIIFYVYANLSYLIIFYVLINILYFCGFYYINIVIIEARFMSHE